MISLRRIRKDTIFKVDAHSYCILESTWMEFYFIYIERNTEIALRVYSFPQLPFALMANLIHQKKKYPDT